MFLDFINSTQILERWCQRGARILLAGVWPVDVTWSNLSSVEGYCTHHSWLGLLSTATRFTSIPLSLSSSSLNSGWSENVLTRIISRATFQAITQQRLRELSRDRLALVERVAKMCSQSLPGQKFNTWWKIIYSIIPLQDKTLSRGLGQLFCSWTSFILFFIVACRTLWHQRLSVCM